MRGSQWEGKGRGPGLGLELVLVVVAVVVALSLYGIYYYAGESQPSPVGQEQAVTTISTTGIQCGDTTMPQSAQVVEQDPRFLDLSNGLCYNYMGENSSGGVSVLTFNYYNGTVVYACGTQADELIASQIKANTSSSTGAISSVQMNASNLNGTPPCTTTPPVAVVSVEDVSSLIPAVPELNVTLLANPGEPLITNLRATLTLVGSTQLFQFVAHPSTLAPGSEVSKTEITSSNSPFSSSEVYPMTISGSFANGQTFSYEAYVQVAGVP